ncbi:hypothetical protein GGQ95_001706 [Anoxybacillus rupiensis]|uniref:Putative transposase n=1 Tax=Parageobacillus caldoxylosilyticus NBRC 107762 TaxID=1220594 RepID=A0A023DKF4_9BACL|nr:hypothetical protein [Parageobacillus caldoxylosilyticus]MBB3907398.1 hypothetical protein [Anoxybacillus rupiensis]GAJ41742.1 putative transposase [Parageobacillus caldoxylosilyticus NBRC 107762]
MKRNGKYRSRQRYLCKGCGKSFNDMTGSPLSGTRYPHKWLKYFEMMIEGYTLPKISKVLDIHISTAFYWRHKILNVIRSLGHSTLKGIVESDETYFLESEKGKKFIAHRKARKRGGVAKKNVVFLKNKFVWWLHTIETDKSFPKWQEEVVLRLWKLMGC